MRIRKRLSLQREIAAYPKTQEHIARECDVHPSKLSRIVNGLADPTPAERIRLAAYLGVTERKLFPRG